MSETMERQRILRRLLLVDDDPGQLQTLSAIMRQEGFTVTECSTAGMALKHFENRDFGVAIIDHRLPDLSGTELLAKMREMNSRVRVILHTGFGSIDSAKAAVNLGAFAYVEKPADPKELVGHVHRGFREGLILYVDDLKQEIEQRKRAEVALRESELWMRSIFSSLEEAVLVVSPDRHIVDINASGERMFGYSRGELVDHSTEPLHVDHEHYVEFGNRIQEAFGCGETAHFEFEAKRKNGGVFPSEHSVSLLKNDAGTTIGIVSVIRDVTERKRAEEALRESEKRYHTLFDQSPDAIVIIDPKTELPIEFNETASQLLGYSTEEFAMLRIRDYEAHESPTEIEAHIAKVLRDGSDRFETQMRTKRGEIKDVVVSIRVVELSGRKVFHNIFRDITEPKRVQEALRLVVESTSGVTGDDFFRSLVRHLASALGVRDAMIGEVVGAKGERVRALAFWSDGRFIEDCEYELAGTPCETVVGREICHYPSGVQERFPDDRVLAEMGVECYLGAPLYDSEGVSLGLLVVTSDRPLTDANTAVSILKVFAARAGAELGRIRAERRMRRREEELAHVARLSSMGEMATGIAHELNQPLSAIMNYASACSLMLESGDRDTERLLRNLQHVGDLAEGASKTIQRIRDFVRKGESSRSTMDINELIRDAISLLSADVRDGRVELVVELADDLPMLKADSVQLQQVIVNLTRNAIEAMRENGGQERVLTLRTSALGAGWIEVAVEDTGPGVADEVRDRLFDPFVTTKIDGLGMGLSISRSIVEAHGGRLSVEPAANGGTAFRFKVPIEPVEVGA